MSMTLVEKKFEAMGARVKIGDLLTRSHGVRNLDPQSNVSIDIRRDKEGEYFEILARQEAKLLVMDVQKKDRHLLLMARDLEGKPLKFLCGHDERHWFTCAVPGGPSTVVQAKQALKPPEIVRVERGRVKAKDSQKHRRRLKGGGKIIRQGEFMFIPMPGFRPDSWKILHNEPMIRGRGNPHMAEYLYREGGTTVYLAQGVPFNVSMEQKDFLRNGLTEAEKNRYIKEHKEAQKYRWSVQRRDPRAYVKGRITHKEHATVSLGEVWHRVALNTENKARGALSISFID